MRTGAPLHFTDVGAYCGGCYWKVHQLARFELRRVDPHGMAGPVSAQGPSSTTACETWSAPTRRRSPDHPPLPRLQPGPLYDAATLGTSVGWSDLYPSDYDKQWIDVSRPARLLRTSR